MISEEIRTVERSKVSLDLPLKSITNERFLIPLFFFSCYGSYEIGDNNLCLISFLFSFSG